MLLCALRLVLIYPCTDHDHGEYVKKAELSKTQFSVGFEGDFGAHEVSPRTLSSVHVNKLICIRGTTCSSAADPAARVLPCHARYGTQRWGFRLRVQPILFVLGVIRHMRI